MTLSRTDADLIRFLAEDLVRARDARPKDYPGVTPFEESAIPQLWVILRGIFDPDLGEPV